MQGLFSEYIKITLYCNCDYLLNKLVCGFSPFSCVLSNWSCFRVNVMARLGPIWGPVLVLTPLMDLTDYVSHCPHLKAEQIQFLRFFLVDSNYGRCTKSKHPVILSYTASLEPTSFYNSESYTASLEPSSFYNSESYTASLEPTSFYSSLTNFFVTNSPPPLEIFYLWYIYWKLGLQIGKFPLCKFPCPSCHVVILCPRTVLTSPLPETSLKPVGRQMTEENQEFCTVVSVATMACLFFLV
jgi:hypothetical protein